MRPSRLALPDARGQGASLRVTRHTAQHKVVISHWREGVCVASTPIELAEVPALIGVLADALGDAIDDAAPAQGRPEPRPSFRDVLQRWLRPTSAQITVLRQVRGVSSGGAESPGDADAD